MHLGLAVSQVVLEKAVDGLDLVPGNLTINLGCMNKNMYQQPDKPVMAFGLGMLIGRNFLSNPKGETKEKSSQKQDSGKPGIYNCTKKINEGGCTSGNKNKQEYYEQTSATTRLLLSLILHDRYVGLVLGVSHYCYGKEHRRIQRRQNPGDRPSFHRFR